MELKAGGCGCRNGGGRTDEGGGMLAGRMRVLVKSLGSCSGGSESESESSSIRACWDMLTSGGVRMFIVEVMLGRCYEL